MTLRSPLSRLPWIAGLLGVTAVLGAGSAWLYRGERERTRDELYRDLSVVGALKAKQIQRWRLERAGDAIASAASPMVMDAAERASRGGSTRGDDAALRTAMRVLASAYEYTDVLLLSPSGTVIFALQDSLTPIGQNARLAVDSAMRSSGAVLSNLFRGEDGRVHVDVAHQVRSASGRPIGAILLRTSADTYLYPLLSDWPTGSRTATTTMLRRDGDNVVVLKHQRASGDELVATAVPVADREIAAVRAALGAYGKFEGVDHRGVRILADLRAIPDSPWYLVTSIDNDEAGAAVWARTRVIVVGGALLILLAAALTAFGYRNRQTKMLNDLYRTERKEREAQAVFRSTFYSIGDGVITTDRDLRITEMNRVAEQLTGWTVSDARGRNLGDVYCPLDEATRRPLTITVSRVPDITREPALLVNHTLLVGRNAEYPIASSAAPIHDDSGAIHGTVLVFRDETRHREQEARHLQDEKMASMGRLAGGIAHDFNNLLSVIGNATELVMNDLGPDDRARGDLEAIQRASQRATGLTRQLLAFSRRQVIQPQMVDLNTVVRNVESLVTRLLRAETRLCVKCAPTLGPVLADPGQLEQVVMNLMLNARDAMPDGGTITIETKEAEQDDGIAIASGLLARGTYVVLVVRDTGTGMNAETRARIFEPFYTTKAKGSGTGLGLATVHGIVQQASGGIAVESEVGRGTEFSVFFPRAESRPLPATA